jgi:hypothetical protein
LAREHDADQTFFTLLQRLEREGRNVSDKPTAPNYAATMFSAEKEARASRLRKGDIEG